MSVSTLSLIHADIKKGINGESFDKEGVAVAVANDLALRDYLIGAHLEFPRESIVTFLNGMIGVMPSADHAFYTILSSYVADNLNEANAYLNTALDLRPDYSLAQLFRRVMTAGWFSTEKLGLMAHELHSKVILDIEFRGDDVVETTEVVG